MNESLLLRLFTLSSLCVIALLPAYYLLGYSTLGIVNSIQHLRSHRSYIFKFEDILIASIATLSLIIISCKIARLFPTIQLILNLSIIVSLVFTLVKLLSYKFNSIHDKFPLPNWRYVVFWCILFVNYLIRSIVKARTLTDAQYIPSRFHTDIFWYIRRSWIFLGQPSHLQFENDQSILDILYASPKLLSTLIYATFTYVSNDIGVSGTIVTSIVLASITVKYIILIRNNQNFDYSLVTLALIALVIFQPILGWMQDQFLWSNLLCIYLLIYTLEDLLVSSQFNSKSLVKFAISMIALAGFYPAQLPFFMIAWMIGLVFHPQIKKNRLKKHISSSFLITIAIFCLFITQYFDTDEVMQRFNVLDTHLGLNIRYISFWSILDLIPKTGGTPRNLGTIVLITISLTIGLTTTRYCIKLAPSFDKWFKLLFALYTVYSCSYIILPGAYRQSKFLFTYIVPLIVFCLIKIVLDGDLKKRKFIKILLPLIAIYVSINSFIQPYKPHVSKEIATVIEDIKLRNNPIIFYTSSGSIAHGYYYFAFQLRDLDFQLIGGCPEKKDLEPIDSTMNTVIIAESCPKITMKPQLQSQIIYTNINGS